MSRHISETIIGALVLAVAAYFFMTAYKQSGMQAGAGTYLVSAQFSDVTGIGIGSDVRIGGVKIGSVQSLELDTNSYQADVNMAVQDRVQLPLDSSAAIVGESLLGGKFVSITPGGDEAMLGSGDAIEFTQSSISLEQLLGKFIFSGGGVEGEEATADDDGLELTLP